MKDPAVRGLVFAWFAIQSAAISNSSLVTVCGLMSLELPLVANGNIAERTVELLFIDVALCQWLQPWAATFESIQVERRDVQVSGGWRQSCVPILFGLLCDAEEMQQRVLPDVQV